MSGKGAKKAPRKMGANGYKLPDPIPVGEILTDVAKKQWIIGPSIGIGGFGEIYSAASYTGGIPKSYPYVVKIERHENGPLFVEMHFYMRNAKASDIASWKKDKKLTFLGMPSFITSGSHDCDNTKYRFVVMERFGKNLWDIFLENNRKFAEHTVYKIAIQIINVLEYMHSRMYVHADIKGGNLLQSLKSPNHIYLVDFGLASHCTNKTEYKSDPKKTHNGTIEYTSRDMHMGIPTMRGDFEILGYNMIQWLTGSLPWENNLKDPSAVHMQKKKAFENIPQFLNKCFSQSVPEPMSQFIMLLDRVEFNEPPNYVKFQEILVKGLVNMGHTPDGKLDISAGGKPQKVLSTPVKPKKSQLQGTRKSPRTPQVKTPMSPPSTLSDSDLGSIIINRRGKTTQKKRQVLKNIEVTDDSDAEIVVKIKRKKKNTKDGNMKLTTRNMETRLSKQTKEKVAIPHGLDETTSDDQLQVSFQDTKSRPKASSKRKHKPTKLKDSSDENNSGDEDMFDDGQDDDDDDDDIRDTQSKKPARSWKDCPTIENSNVSRPGEYKPVNQSKGIRARKR